MQLSYEFIKPAAEPAPTVKDSKDSKNVMTTEAATASIWQRILWGTKLTVGVITSLIVTRRLCWARSMITTTRRCIRSATVTGTRA